MVDLRKLHESTGLRSCLVENGKVVDSYLLTDDELDCISKIISVMDILPPSFEFGIFNIREIGCCVMKVKNGEIKFVISPVTGGNIGELYRKFKLFLASTRTDRGGP